MEAKLYVILGSHACRTGMLLMEHKGIEYERVELPTGLHPPLLRLRGFAGNPAPFRRLDGRTNHMLGRADRMGTVPLLWRQPTVRRVGAGFLARFVFRANPSAEQELLSALPGMLDHVDGWIATGVLNGDELNAADFMIAPCLALLCYRRDLRPEIERRPAIQLVNRVLPEPAGR
jgi:glutathione S-transferase